MQFFWDTFYSVRVRLVGPTRPYLSDFLHVCRDDLGPNLELHSPLLKIQNPACYVKAMGSIY